MRFSAFIFLFLIILNTTAKADTMPKTDAAYLAADLHCDAAMKIVKGKTLTDNSSQVTIGKLKKGRVGLQVFACWVPPSYRRQKAIDYTLKMISMTKSQISSHSSQLMLVTDKVSWQKCLKEKKTGVLLGIEGGHALGEETGNLKLFYKEGVRILTLTWNNSNKFATAGFSAGKTKKDLGLTAEGIKLVKLADSLGVMIDLSHSSEKTFWDVLKLAKKPPLASHSCARALNKKFQFRNLSDKQIKALAQAGGLIGVNFCPAFLGEKRKPVDINSVADQFDYMKKLAGVDCLALGSDFDGIEEVPKGLEGPDKIPDLLKVLEKQGFGKDEISKIALDNFIRYMGWRN
ncbi:membrane dipeptidase [candidate division TA06 bacterium]|uniref:Membrane dipeptidase n=1 Tax=candidate division TA06 bacterium TaxID=2250710 RepID=A0A933IAY5_UNCT6|nr:membrane dipeptidase [candidate division TA06 bacterium]